MPKQKNNYFILTGAMGAGKSTLLNQILSENITLIPEPARQILAEQRSINGNGVPETNPKLFTELMLSRAIFQYRELENHPGPVIFDRGIADNIVYADLFEFELEAAKKAAEEYRYNKLVFFLGGWEEIYCTDAERKMSFAAANKFGADVKNIYADLGYEILELPRDTAKVRAQIIIDAVLNK